MPTSTSYDLVTASSGTIQVPYATSSPGVWTRGQTATYTFEFPRTYTFPSDYTVSGTESYENVVIPAGVTVTIPSGATLNVDSIIVNGTLTNNGTLNTASGMLADFNEFVEWAGSYTTLEMLNGVERYRVQIPASAGIESLVVGIEPNQDLQDRDVVGVWGLVDSITNERNQALSTNRYSVDVNVLAPYGEYADVSSVETDLLV